MVDLRAGLTQKALHLELRLAGCSVDLMVGKRAGWMVEKKVELIYSGIRWAAKLAND